MLDIFLGKYLTLEDFCTCTNTYQKNVAQINPYPKSLETIKALQELNQYIIEPIIDHFGLAQFQLTYGFCSTDLKKILNQKDPITKIKNGRIEPSRDQHMAHEINKNGQYYCKRLGAACDFLILNCPSDQLVDWILNQKLPFDSLYYYDTNRPIHISYGFQHKRAIWTFTKTNVPTRQGIERWMKRS